MTEQTVRLAVVLVVIAAAIVVALVFKKLQRPLHPEIIVGDVGERPGVVLFTSTGCSICGDVISMLESESIPLREVTFELEPQRFETWMVFAVPLTVFLDGEGRVVSLISGVPRLRELRRAVRMAGVSATTGVAGSDDSGCE